MFQSTSLDARMDQNGFQIGLRGKSSRDGQHLIKYLKTKPKRQVRDQTQNGCEQTQIL